MSAEPVLERSESGPARSDRLLIWPASIPIAAALFAATANSLEPVLGMLSLLIGVLVVFWWLVGVIVAIGFAAWRRAWRRASSLLAILICAGPAMAVSMIAGDYIHLLLALPYYASKIASSGKTPGPISFDWPSQGLIPNYERYLVYDSSDELASHIGKAEPWGPDAVEMRTVGRLAGHFYLVVVSW